MTPREEYQQNVADTIITKLEKRQMKGYYCKTAKEAVAKAASLVTSGCTVGFGGSMTLEETGMLEYLRGRSDITLLDRSAAKNSDEVKAIYHEILSADYFFMSTNAITIDGELINIDGTGNRLAALIYGPEHVIIIAGMNKVVYSEEEGISRAHNIAAAANCNRLNRNTPCAKTGVCANCQSPDCICSQTVITRRSGVANRIQVILVEESLGY